MQTGQFGNMLLLDDDPNLADSDKSYTEVSQCSVYFWSPNDSKLTAKI